MITATLPDSNVAARMALYGGTVFQRPATAASRALADAVLELLRAELGGEDERARASSLDAASLFGCIGRVRRALYTEARWHQAVREVIGALGFSPAEYAFDPLRLRTVLSGGHHLAAAAPVYVGHRDTWYAHPQNALTWWIPLDDLAAAETFAFYPDMFAVPVRNDSEIFDYDAWVRDGWDLKIGWQNSAAGQRARYPASSADHGALRSQGFDCRKADNLIFAAAHLHRTLPQTTGRTRFSLDFRIAHLGDFQSGVGAPNVDNRSRGSVMPDYTQPVPRSSQIDRNASPPAAGGRGS